MSQRGWWGLPLESASRFHPVRSCWATAAVGVEFISILLVLCWPKAIAAFPSPLLQKPDLLSGCHVI